MTDHTSRSPAVHATTARAGVTAGERLLALITAALLGVDAYVHLHDAARYDGFASSVMTEGTLFRIQAGVAIVVAALLLIRPAVLTWLLSLLVAASAAGAVTLYTYVDVGQLGPLPNLYENSWHQPGKIASAVAEAVAALISLAGLAVAAPDPPAPPGIAAAAGANGRRWPRRPRSDRRRPRRRRRGRPRGSRTPRATGRAGVGDRRGPR